MNVRSLRFSHYRNLCQGEYRPCPGVNLLYGNNAQGKTNLLEAIWLFTSGKSFRGARDGELVAFEQPSAQLEMDFTAAGRDQSAEIIIKNSKRTAALNGVDKGAASRLVGNFCAVVFSPEHLSLVKDGPMGRRQFIDAALCQQTPAYASLLGRYQHTLTQRNALLKDIPRHSELLDTLDIWEDKLARYGAGIALRRMKYIADLSPFAAGFYQGIAEGKETLEVHYQSSFWEQEQPTSQEQLQTALQHSLLQNRREDIACGFTTVGPHRDDVALQVDGRSARMYASQGQQRSTVLALKLAEASILMETLGERPVVLLDDVMSELDTARQDYLLNHIQGWQVFITCCEPTPVLRLVEGTAVRIQQGELLADAPPVPPAAGTTCENE